MYMYMYIYNLFYFIYILYIFFHHVYIYVYGVIYRVSRKVRTHFNRLKLKSWITYEKKIHITKVSIKCHFLNKFGKTVNLSFNGLTGVN